MERPIDVRYCRNCGRMEQVESIYDRECKNVTVRIWCPCGMDPARIEELDIEEAYYLRIEAREEEAADDADTDSGDVQAGGEAGRASDV